MPVFSNDPPMGWTSGDLAAVLHLDSTRTGVLLRRALRESFPGVRFTVRQEQYRWEAHIVVGWTDGPSRAQVERITARFQSARCENHGKGGERWYRNYRTMTVEPFVMDGMIRDTVPVVFGPEIVRAERSYSVGLLTRVRDENPTQTLRKQWDDWSIGRKMEGKAQDAVLDVPLPYDVDERYGVEQVERSPTAEAIKDIDRARFEAMVDTIRGARARMWKAKEQQHVE